MNGEEATAFLLGITGNWPHAKMPSETLDLWQTVLGTLDYDEAVATLWEEFGDSEFPPAPLALSKRAMSRRRGPAVTAEDLVAELQSKIASVGYTGHPEWSHPAIAEYVRTEGGWIAVCQGSKAPGAPEYGTYYAQMRNRMRVLLDREELADARSSLEQVTRGTHAPELGR